MGGARGRRNAVARDAAGLRIDAAGQGALAVGGAAVDHEADGPGAAGTGDGLAGGGAAVLAKWDVVHQKRTMAWYWELAGLVADQVMVMVPVRVKPRPSWPVMVSVSDALPP